MHVRTVRIIIIIISKLLEEILVLLRHVSPVGQPQGGHSWPVLLVNDSPSQRGGGSTANPGCLCVWAICYGVYWGESINLLD